MSEQITECAGCYDRDNAITAMRTTRDDMQRRIIELEQQVERWQGVAASEAHRADMLAQTLRASDAAMLAGSSKD